MDAGGVGWRIRPSVVGVAVIGLVASGCAGGGSKHDTDGAVREAMAPVQAEAAPAASPAAADGGPQVAEPGAVASDRFVAHASCDTLLERLRAFGMEAVQSPPSRHWPPGRRTVGAGSSAGSVESGFSPTNVRVAGVDEPDIVKTDGRLLVVSRNDRADHRIEILDVAATPTVVAEIEVSDASHGEPSELLLVEDRLVAVRQLYLAVGDDPSSASSLRGPTAEVIVYDLHDPSRPEEVERHRFEGSLAGARLVGNTVHLGLSSVVGARLELERPRTDTDRARKEAVAVNRKRLRRSTLEDWLPQFERVAVRSGERTTGTLATCGGSFTDAGALDHQTTLVTMTLAGAVHRTSVFGGTDTIYVSDDMAYLTGAGEGARFGRETTVHAFDLVPDGPATHVAKGAVPGRVGDQWRLDRHEGRLRVVSDRVIDEPDGGIHTRLSVLEQRGSSLVEVGAVDGIARGETAFGVRFVGDLAFVVTFRIVDPLHVIDLSQPATPRRRGDLEVPGVSFYLHPVGAGRLLGVGIDGERAPEMSLFDVADPDSPTRPASVALGGVGGAGRDHRAILWWEPLRLAVVAEMAGPATVVHVAGDRLEVRGRLDHLDRPGDEGVTTGGHPGFAVVRRTLVLGDRLLSVSHLGVLASDPATLEDRSWTPFPGAPRVEGNHQQPDPDPDGEPEPEPSDPPGTTTTLLPFPLGG